jgi:3-phosphoshikimate 1-carboxyvinyltransferase
MRASTQSREWYNASVLLQTRPAYESSVTLRAVASPVSASVEIPGSKSITNRALLLAALAGGVSVLRRPLLSDDTEHMIAALQAMGSGIELTPDEDLIITGVSGKPCEPSDVLYIGLSGTSVRFLTAACVNIPANGSCVLDGVERMRQRPIQDLIDALVPLGARIESLNGTGCPPVQVYGGGLVGGKTAISGAVSSQFLSALMMSSPLASSAVEICISGRLVSRPYMLMTESVMEAFGIELTHHPDDSLTIPAPQSYKATDYAIEPDASNASYFLAAAAVSGGMVTVPGLTSTSIQGDVQFARVLEQAGCTAFYTSNGITVQGPQRLRGVDVNMTLTPDMAQTLAVVCLFADGPSTIRGIHTLRVKETDRIEAVASELRKLGAEVEAGDDYWIIDPPAKPAQTAAICTYDDHRMAMAFAVAGLRVDGLTIDDPGCVAKTFPDFWQRWNQAFNTGGNDDA